MRREREPSRISLRIVTRLFKRRQTKRAVKLYIKKCVPASSMLKAMLCGHIRNHFFDQCTRSKLTVFPKKSVNRRNLFVVRMRTFKHKKSPLFCIGAEDNIYQKLRQLHIDILYHLPCRIISLSGDVELNPGPSNQSNNAMCSSSPTNFVPLLETRLSNFGRTAIDVGGGDDCFFRAVSHQLYGNPNNHFYLRSVGVQYLIHNPEQFIESNTEHSWQYYLQRMSNQGTWADAIIIQAVANCLNLSIHIIESNPAFSSVTVVEPINVTDVSLRIYIGHVDEIHYVSTSEMQSRYSNSETNKDQKNQGAQERELNLEHVREIKRNSFRKRKAANPELVRQINKQSSRKRKAANPELVLDINKHSSRKQKAANPELVQQINKHSSRKRKAANPELVLDINKHSSTKRKAANPELVRDINKHSSRKRKAANPEVVKETKKQSFKRKKASNPEFETVMQTRGEVITFENSPNPLSVEMRLYKHGKSALLLLKNNSQKYARN